MVLSGQSLLLMLHVPTQLQESSHVSFVVLLLPSLHVPEKSQVPTQLQASSHLSVVLGLPSSHIPFSGIIQVPTQLQESSHLSSKVLGLLSLHSFPI